jgi:hypothetical protein
MRFFDEDSRQSLRELIEGPISAPPLEESVAAELSEPGEDSAQSPALAGDALDGAAELEAYLDPRLVEGPNTRYLDLDELTLLPTLDRLDRLDAYTPLIHGGWEQNGLAEADAVPIDLGEFDSSNPRGTIRLHMSRYLHISVDMAYRPELLPPEPPGDPLGPRTAPTVTEPPFGFRPFAASEEPEPAAYIMLEQRRILRGELNYFDHPAFGLLLQITLAPEPESDPAPDAEGPSA